MITSDEIVGELKDITASLIIAEYMLNTEPGFKHVYHKNTSHLDPVWNKLKIHAVDILINNPNPFRVLIHTSDKNRFVKTFVGVSEESSSAAAAIATAKYILELNDEKFREMV